MDAIRVLIHRLRSLLRGRDMDIDLDQELRAHIEMATEANIHAGMDTKAARLAALRSFGGITQTRENYRSQRSLPGMESLLQDIRFGARMLAKRPGFTIIAILTLALGIGGNTAIFSIVNGVLLNPLPFPQPDQLVALHESKPNFPQGSISYPNFLDWQRENHSFSSIAIARGYPFTLTRRGDAEQVAGEFVSTDFFSLLAVQPLLGRTFVPSEEQAGAAPVALISEGLWRRKFDASTAVLGQPITLDSRSYTIVGVIPAAFRLRFSNFSEQDVYVPIRQWTVPVLMNRGAGLSIHGIARLKPGVTLQQARADMDGVTRNLAATFPDANQGVGASIVPLKEQMVGDARPFLLVLLGAVGFVLLIACVNVASLLLARSAGRSREFAVRVALGASRGRVIRQLLTENLLLGLIAGALGLGLAAWGTRAALKLLPAALPRAEEIGLDFRVLAFTATISLFTAVVFGLAPAMASSQGSPGTTLKAGGRGVSGTHRRALGAFVAVEMAVALVLLIGAGLMVRTLVRLWNVDPGFNPKNVLIFNLTLPSLLLNASPDRIRATFRDIDDKFASTPGIKAISPIWGALPMGGDDERLFWLQGQPRPATDSAMGSAIDYIVEPDYLRMMQIPLRRGRFFSAQDHEHTPSVVVIDEVFAQKYFPGQDPIGKRIHLATHQAGDDGDLAEIIGVVNHVKQWGLDVDNTQSLRAQFYLPCSQMPDSYVSQMNTGSGMVVRYEGNLAAVADALRRASKEISSEQVVYGDQTMESVVSDTVASRRFAMILLSGFAAMALLLACIGIYGVTSYLVSQRTQEMGVRMALGAQRRDVLKLILVSGARLTAMGIGLGMAAALVLTRVMRSLLFEVSATDPIVLVGVSLTLIVVALAACLLPAMRAARIEPMEALRAE